MSTYPDFAALLAHQLEKGKTYSYCRKLSQLEAVQVIQVTRGAETYLHACLARGQKLGNIKPSILQKTTGWDAYFEKPGVA